MFIYVIEKGDTLYKLANSFDTTIEDIATLNNINVDDTLVIGQSLVIPSDNVKYVVRRGDTMYSIARQYGITLDDLINANPSITNPNNISVGQVINIPIYTIKPYSGVVNGYMLPGINLDTLDKTLPYLDYLSIFSYEVMSTGELRPIMDSKYIDMAKSDGVKPLMTITNIGGEGFSSDIAHDILVDTNVQDLLIANILEIMNTKGYFGLNVDFEYLYPEDRDLYTDFLRKLSGFLSQNGYILAVAVAPKTSDNQMGILYEAHDYKAIGSIADIVIIMTYEWGYLYGDPQPISPINKIDEVISYAVTQIPADKILLGVSNYAYDWTLPYVKGVPAMYMSNVQAINLARTKGSNIMFDDESQSPYFRYYTPSGQHIVWFEDARTLLAKLELVKKYNLLGISYWNINYYINASGLLDTTN